MDVYHLRRKDKAITDPDVLRAIIAEQKYMVLALCRENVPYLVTLSYGYDAEANCFYFHCAPEGKKMDYLRANPHVWGQILQDDGYLLGECNHAFHTVHFEGTVTFLQTLDEKRHALEVMIEHLETDPAPLKARLLDEARVAAVTIGRVAVHTMMGKQNG